MQAFILFYSEEHRRCFSRHIAVTSAAAELKESAPTVSKLLSACSCPQWQSKVVSDQLSARLVTAAACLLKARNQQMSALQYIVSIVLHNPVISGLPGRCYHALHGLLTIS